ncbi:hypothetical protein M2U14_25700, partial [Klebsiella pneumoniae]|nr:hypothetical protein [Klebsiella pneumoniae]
LLCHGTVCVVGKMRDLILQLSKSSIYSTKPFCCFRLTSYLSKKLAVDFLLVIWYWRLLGKVTFGVV